MSPTKPRILIAIDWYSPGYRGGGPITSIANLVDALSDRFEFSIITSDRDLGDKQPYPGVVLDEWVQQSDCRVWYCSREGTSYRHWRRLIAETEYDLLYLNSMFSLKFTIFPLWCSKSARPQLPVLLAPRGMLHAGALGLKPLKKKLFLATLKATGIPRHLHFHATDPQEVADIQTIFGTDTRVWQAPNLPRMHQTPFQATDKTAGNLRLVYLSRLSAKKGLHTVLELLAAQKHQVSLDIIGPDEETGYWEKCAALIAKLPPNVQVQKQEAMQPEEARRHLLSAHCFIMPTLGENFGHAIFEALAAGRPVLISDKTPWRGLEEAGIGWDLPLEDRQDMAAALDRLANMDQQEWGQWALRAWHYAEAFLARPDISEEAAALFTKVIEDEAIK